MLKQFQTGLFQEGTVRGTAVLPLFLCACGPFAPPARSASFSEIGDAGQSAITAQGVFGAPGTPLTRISGTLGNSEADLFRIRLTGGAFSASTISALSNLFDTSLFLFTGAGVGVYAND
ncbi:MAG TPA: hypothetical protein DEH78_08300, partial [Solibacterales bacterium]|nr:hypothetical protein [Bryobacterales bacterium]